jgi:hypothetical protein
MTTKHTAETNLSNFYSFKNEHSFSKKFPLMYKEMLLSKKRHYKFNKRLQIILDDGLEQR